jgi:hypothetical protein
MTQPVNTRIRNRLIHVVTKLARAHAAGDVTPEPWELEALAVVLKEYRLPVEAARVRRWIPK